MFKISTPRLLVILAILIGIFAIVKFTGNQDRSKTLRTELVLLDQENVTKVEISGPESDLVLEKSESGWTVTSAAGTRNAVTNTVTSMLSTLRTIEPSRIASRSDSKWKDYAVDSTGTRVKVYEGTEMVTDIVLGRFGVEGQRSFYTYVRLAEDADTYVANNFMKMSINTNPDDFRNSEILRLNRDSLSSIAFNYPDSSLVLSKSDERWYNGVSEADSAASESYVRGLSMISSREFVDAENLGTPTLNVTYGFMNQNEIQVSAYNRPEGWVIQSTTNPDEVWVDDTQFSKIFAASSQFLTSE